MTRLRRFAIALLAVATVTVGTFGIVPTVSALPRCGQLQALHDAYWTTGHAFYSIGAYSQAWYWWGRAAQVIASGCQGFLGVNGE